MKFMRRNRVSLAMILMIGIFVAAFGWSVIPQIWPPAPQIQALTPDNAWAANGTFTTNKHWVQKWESFGATAGEAITIGDAIALNRYNGKAYKADADDADRRPAVGFAGNTAASGAKVEVVTRGILSGMPAGLGTESSNCVTPIGTPLLLDKVVQGRVTVFQTPTTGVSQYMATAGPLSQEAVRAGVTTGTDTYIVNTQMPRSGTSGVAAGQWE
jgi:hypothetical protein